MPPLCRVEHCPHLVAYTLDQWARHGAGPNMSRNHSLDESQIGSSHHPSWCLSGPPSAPRVLFILWQGPCEHLGKTCSSTECYNYIMILRWSSVFNWLARLKFREAWQMRCFAFWQQQRLCARGVRVFRSRRGRPSPLKCEAVGRIDYANTLGSQSPAWTFVQIQKQMSMPMNRLRENLQFTWPFYWKILRHLWWRKEFPKRFDKGQSTDWSIIWNLVSNNYLWLDFKIAYKKNLKWLSSGTRQISLEFPNILVLTLVLQFPVPRSPPKKNRREKEGPPSLPLSSGPPKWRTHIQRLFPLLN